MRCGLPIPKLPPLLTTNLPANVRGQLCQKVEAQMQFFQGDNQPYLGRQVIQSVGAYVEIYAIIVKNIAVAFVREDVVCMREHACVSLCVLCM